MWMTMDGGEKRSELEPGNVSVMMKDFGTNNACRLSACCDAPRDRRSAVCQRRHWCSHCCAFVRVVPIFPCCDTVVDLTRFS